MKIVYIVGSLAKESLNRGLAKALVAASPEGVEFVEAPINELPVYNRDFDGDFPKAALDLKAVIESADGVVFITPEHNRMYSAALANALEWSSRPWGSMSLFGKPVATIGTSPSGVGTASAQQHLRTTLAFFNTKIMGQPEGYIDANKAGLTPAGELNEGGRKIIEDFVGAFVDYVKANS